MKPKKIAFKEKLTAFYKYPSICVYQDQIPDMKEYTRYLDTPSTQSRQQMIYIHVPFCRYICTFCPFYKMKDDAEQRARYVEALVKELTIYGRSAHFKNVPITNIHFGGGTPMLLSIEEFTKIFECLHTEFNTKECKVISIEGDAFTLQDGEKLKKLKEYGMTRVSFGIQTFNEKLRQKLGLLPRVNDIYEAVKTFRKAGIDEFGCDILYNMPEQNVNEVRYSLDRVCELEPSGVDFYDLNIMPNSKISRMIERGQFVTPPSNQKEIDMFQAGIETFYENNYEHVRAFVFKPKGSPDAHPNGILNRYRADLLACGPSARTILYSGGKNYRNHCDLNKYVESLDKNELPIEAGNDVSDLVLAERDLMLFPYYLSNTKEEVHYDLFVDKIEDMIYSGYVRDLGDTLELTELGRFWYGNVQYYFHGELEKMRIANTTFEAIKNKTSIFNQDKMTI